MNQVTSHLDASSIYGSTAEEQHELRLMFKVASRRRIDNSLWSARHNFFGEGNSLWLLDMGTSWYFSWKLNYFGIPKWKQGLFNIPQSGHESVYLLEPSFHSRTPNNSTFMKNISWCPCLKVRVNFLPRRNYAAHFTVFGRVGIWANFEIESSKSEILMIFNYNNCILNIHFWFYILEFYVSFCLRSRPIYLNVVC